MADNRLMPIIDRLSVHLLDSSYSVLWVPGHNCAQWQCTKHQLAAESLNSGQHLQPIAAVKGMVPVDISVSNMLIDTDQT